MNKCCRVSEACTNDIIVIPPDLAHKDNNCCCKDPFENTPNAIFIKLSDTTIQSIVTLIAALT